MPFPKILSRLFENGGAGPKLKKDILPPHADTHAPNGDDPLDLASLGGVSSDDFSELKKKVEDLIKGISNIDPWTVFPPRLPVAIDGVTFGGSDGRRAIMPGETEAREDWILCDGGSDGKGGTVPDLRGRMILGASDEHEAGSTGGSETHTHSVTGTVGETTLSTPQMPTHNHKNADQSGGYGSNPSQRYLTKDLANNAFGPSFSDNTGGSQSHTHSLSGVSSEAADSLPPYYALPLVIRCG